LNEILEDHWISIILKYALSKYARLGGNMSFGGKLSLVIVLSLFLTTSFLTVSVLIPERGAAYTSHSPILINGNGDFTAANGVTSGIGTFENPYIIEGLKIGLTQRGSGIMFNGTNAHCILQNLELYSNLETTDFPRMGIAFYETTNCSLKNLKISNFQFGIHLNYAENILISENKISSNEHAGINMYSANNITITNNVISNNGAGISIAGATFNLLIYHNDFIENTMQANDVFKSGNEWDNGYLDGGNYWSDYNGVDEYNGPNQDILGADGIGDISYNNNLVDDGYPLIKPWANRSQDNTNLWLLLGILITVVPIVTVSILFFLRKKKPFIT